MQCSFFALGRKVKLRRSHFSKTKLDQRESRKSAADQTRGMLRDRCHGVTQYYWRSIKWISVESSSIGLISDPRDDEWIHEKETGRGTGNEVYDDDDDDDDDDVCDDSSGGCDDDDSRDDCDDDDDDDSGDCHDDCDDNNGDGCDDVDVMMMMIMLMVVMMMMLRW